MEKIIILSFVLLACVCVICQGGTHSVTSTLSSTSTTPSSSVAVNATSKSMPSTTSTVVTTPTDKAVTKEPTSGAVSVKSFTGLVFSFFVIALL